MGKRVEQFNISAMYNYNILLLWGEFNSASIYNYNICDRI